MDAETIAATLSAEELAMMAGWPKCDGLLYRDRAEPGPVAQSLIDKGLCGILPWKHGTQLAMKSPGLAVREVLLRNAGEG